MSGEGPRPTSEPQGGWTPPPGWQPPPSPPPPYHYAYAPPPPYGPQYPYPPPHRQTDGIAITALVLAIASFYVFPLIPAIVALALSPSARRNIESSGGTLTGESLVTAARAISWFNIGLCVLAVVVIAVIALLAAAFDDTDEFSLALSLLS